MKNNFKEKSFLIIRNAITKDLAEFIYYYFLLKRQVAKTLIDTKYISPFVTYFGVWNDPQVMGTYSHYADTAMETLLMKVIPIMEKKTKLKLIPTYSFARIYKKGDVLKKHKDRESCEISTTLNLGGDPWPIYIEPDKTKGTFDKNGYVPSNSKGVKVELNPGDMLIYRGCDLEHWRNEFKGEDCAQVFLHYNDASSKLSLNNKMDSRPHLGLPSDIKGYM
jgi:hypothetical protein